MENSFDIKRRKEQQSRNKNRNRNYSQEALKKPKHMRRNKYEELGMYMNKKLLK